MEAYFNELNYASLQLLNLPQEEKIISRYWEIMDDYVKFIRKYLLMLNKT